MTSRAIRNRLDRERGTDRTLRWRRSVARLRARGLDINTAEDMADEYHDQHGGTGTSNDKPES